MTAFNYLLAWYLKLVYSLYWFIMNFYTRSCIYKYIKSPKSCLFFCFLYIEYNCLHRFRGINTGLIQMKVVVTLWLGLPSVVIEFCRLRAWPGTPAQFIYYFPVFCWRGFSCVLNGFFVYEYCTFILTCDRCQKYLNVLDYIFVLIVISYMSC